ncbi:MAG: transporter substrate-binding domain-containing protein [Saccharospirillaceae bacterium]|nr:transporter substrate-binding domain-containing protein [Saccharospirillaceae bacterium]MCD8530127.1 transporter substrate-binding domain-containing protein [Saccharospirillaceae bacterium]
MNVTYYGICLITTALCLCTPASAGPLSTPITDNQFAADTLIIGVETTDYAPYYHLQDNRYSGLGRDILDAFLADAHLMADYYPLPVPRLFLLFTQQQLDFKFPDNPQWSEDLKSGLTVYYSEPVIQVTEAVMILNDHQGPVRNIGTIMGFTTPGINAEIQRGELTITQVNSMDQMLKMLENRRIDGIYFNTRAARHAAAERASPLTLTTLKQIAPYHYAYHLSSIRHPHLIERFDRFMHDNPEVIRALRQSYNIP